MELLLIRHALPVRRELTTGRADPELSPDGFAQAERLAEYLATEHLDSVYASPLLRAQQTAAPLAARFGTEVTTAAGVAEWDQDSTEYVPVEELKEAGDPRWQDLLDGVWTSDEPEEAFRTRVLDTVEDIVQQHSGGKVAVVCHGGVINAYLAHVLSLGNGGERGFFYPNYTSINRVAAARSGQRSIVTINETSHLRNTGLPMGLFQTG